MALASTSNFLHSQILYGTDVYKKWIMAIWVMQQIIWETAEKYTMRKIYSVLPHAVIF